MNPTFSNIKAVVSSAMTELHIKEKWDYKTQKTYKNVSNEKAIQIQFIPKALENEKYSAYLFHSNHLGVWMGKYGLLNGKPRIFKPVLVMDNAAVKKMAMAQNAIELSNEQKEQLASPSEDFTPILDAVEP